MRLGSVLLQRGKLAEARTAFTSALARAPDPAAQAGLGETALAERHFKEAIIHLRAALEKAPEATRLHYSLAMAYRGLGDLDQARRHLEQRGTPGLRPVDPVVDQIAALLRGERVHRLEGQLAYAAGQFEAAAAAFSSAVDAAPESARAHTDLGAALAGLGDADGAIAALEAAVRLDDSSLAGHFNLGVLLAGRNDQAAAIPHFERVLAERDNDLEVRRQLAGALLAVGRLADAEGHLQEVVYADPDDEASLMRLVELQVGQRRYRDALERLERAESESPGRERVRNALARLLAAAPDQSLRDGARALEIGSALYAARPTVAHGETVALALAEVGRCGDAAELQRTLVATAERAGATETVEALTSAVGPYERGTPCRPPSDGP